MEQTRFTMTVPVEIKFCTASNTPERDLAEIAKSLLPLEIERGTATINSRDIEVVAKRKVLTKAEAEKESEIWAEFLKFRKERV